MVAAPAAVRLAALKVTVATPVESVSAVLEAGAIVAKVASVLNETTALATPAPAVSFTAAFTVAGAPLEMEVTATPALLVSATVMLDTDVALTEYPVDPVTSTAGVPTWLVAVIVAAPAAVKLAGLSVAVATPLSSVSAEAGKTVPNVVSVLNITSAPLTPTPWYFTVALTVAGALLEMDDIAAPEPLVSATVRFAILLTEFTE